MRARPWQVLPPLLQELRTPELVPIILPIVLKILPQQDGAEFVETSLPALRCAGRAVQRMRRPPPWRQRHAAQTCPAASPRPAPPRRPLLTGADGDALLMLLQCAEVLAATAPKPVAAQLVPALLVRGMESGEWDNAMGRVGKGGA